MNYTSPSRIRNSKLSDSISLKSKKILSSRLVNSSILKNICWLCCSMDSKARPMICSSSRGGLCSNCPMLTSSSPRLTKKVQKAIFGRWVKSQHKKSKHLSAITCRSMSSKMLSSIWLDIAWEESLLGLPCLISISMAISLDSSALLALLILDI